MTYLIAYDITGNKKRGQVAKQLKAAGGIRLQKSVFFIHLSQSGLHGLEQRINSIWQKRKANPKDQLIIVKIHQAAFYKMKIVGQQFDPVLALGKENTIIL